MPLFPRSSGILLHVTSLPGPFGVGDMGEAAYRFVDFLVEAGQQIWQILPLSPSIQCNSPYSSYSAFAGNPLLISPALLIKDGYLGDQDVNPLPDASPASVVDYAAATDFKQRILSLAHARFKQSPNCADIDEYESFCTLNQWWLEDFALFSALLEHFGHDQWSRWDEGLARRDRDTLQQWRHRLSDAVDRARFVQFLFFQQWQQLKQYANRRQVRVFGDMPIFVSYGSADVWANQNLFYLDDAGRPEVVAGVPPDYFSATGQLWGNPLYRWDRLAGSDYRWWIHRMRSAFESFDLVRIDHFRGFEAYWEIPAGAATAVHGQWQPGPGIAFFESVKRHLGDLAIVAEDLGLITPAVHQLRDQCGFPGMRVLQFGFESPTDGYHRPENFPANSVAYTGTHDNETIMGWYENRQYCKAQTGKRDLLDKYLSADTRERLVHWQLITMVLNSASHTAIVPMQDVLGLDNQARMNLPGEAHGNWRWRLRADQLSDEIAAGLRVVTEHAGRLQPARVG